MTGILYFTFLVSEKNLIDLKISSKYCLEAKLEIIGIRVKTRCSI